MCHYRRRANAAAFAPLAEQRHAWETASLAPEVRREIDRLQRADLVILQFPLWWHAQPAMLKGWFDRVFVSGGLYTSRLRYDRGAFRGKRALLSVTSGAPATRDTATPTRTAPPSARTWMAGRRPGPGARRLPRLGRLGRDRPGQDAPCRPPG